MTQPLASVLLITYQHARYIAQALDSALMQQTDFDFEIVVGEDGSVDGTRELVQTYVARYSEKVRAVFADQNRGGHANLLATLRCCRGEYIAMLEGDDYWTAPHKLQAQVDFLRRRPDFALCGHRVQSVSPDGQPIGQVRPEGPVPERCGLVDFVGNNYMATCATVFRRQALDRIPAWYPLHPNGDWLLHLFMARHGAAGFIDEVMGAYRIHAGGAWNSKSNLERLRIVVNARRRFHQILDRRCRRANHRHMAAELAQMALIARAAGHTALSGRYAFQSLGRDPFTHWEALVAIPWRHAWREQVAKLKRARVRLGAFTLAAWLTLPVPLRRALKACLPWAALVARFRDNPEAAPAAASTADGPVKVSMIQPPPRRKAG